MICTPGDSPHNVHASYIPHTYILPESDAVSYFHRTGKRQAYTTTITHLTDLPLCRHGNPEESLYFQESHNPFQFAIMLHTLLENMELRNTYTLLFFFNYSSAFSTIQPYSLCSKPHYLSLNIPSWTVDFLSNCAPSPPLLSSSPAHHKGVCWALCSTPCSPTTALLLSPPTSSSHSLTRSRTNYEWRRDRLEWDKTSAVMV